MTSIRTLATPALLALALFGPAVQAGGLVPPQGYYAGIEKPKTSPNDFTCEAVPKPYTGALQFRSKYEGSDKARATLNKASEKAFRDSTADITTLERGVSKQVMQYMRDGRPQQLDCTLQWLGTWAQADALLSTDYNHTGKSMRKWALGSMSGSWLRLKFSNSQPLAAHRAEAELIDAVREATHGRQAVALRISLQELRARPSDSAESEAHEVISLLHSPAVL